MVWVFVAVLLLLLILTVLFTVALKIKFIFDSDAANMSMTLLWLHPLIKARVSMENANPMITVYLFNKRVYKGPIKAGGQKSGKVNMLEISNPKDVHVNAYYGFQDPFETGVACGAINIASQFINIDTIQQIPDFTSEKDYIYIDATAKVNVGSTLVNLYKARAAEDE